MDGEMAATLVDLETGVRHWIDRWSETRGEIIPHRQRADQTRIEKYILPHFGRRSVSRITTDQVEEWVEDLRSSGVGSATIYASLMTLRQALDLAVDGGVIQTNPAKGVKVDGVNVVREVQPDEILTEDQLQRILEHIDPYYAALVLLVARTGLRWEEVMGLRVRDLDLAGRTAVVGKYRVVEQAGAVHELQQKEFRRIALPKDVVRSLKSYLNDTADWRTKAWDWVFLTKRDHRHLLRPNFNIHVWRPALRAAGLDERAVTFNALRHKAAVDMIEQGADVEEIARVFGHASEMTTRKMYKRYFRERDARRKRDAK